MIGAVPDASLNMIGRPDDDPCPYKQEYIEENDNTVVVFLSLSTLEREKQHGGFCSERGSQTQSLVCHLSGAMAGVSFFSRPSPATVLYIYI